MSEKDDDMGPLDYFLRVLVNIIMAMVLGSLMIGLLGLLVAGQEGFVNGMVWGAAFGILGGLAVTSTFDSLAFWNGFFSRFNKSKFEETPDDRK
ncbi:MAG: hypothetical protein KDE28_06385 [Anaerolineales bacterium]|nr:hypothetical protein [Anaerolineales bacterium]